MTQNIINALPLVADALGRKYGIRVYIGGDTACTNGREIHLPSLPPDADEVTLNLVRAYLDHEAAHLRYTDFELLSQCSSSVEKHIWNILEDFMVERRLSAVYPGCQENLKWLGTYLFGNRNKTEGRLLPPLWSLLEWLLFEVQALTIQGLDDARAKRARTVDQHYPGLRDKLTPLLETVPLRCVNTASCAHLAREIMEMLEQYATKTEEPQKVLSQEDMAEDTEETPCDLLREVLADPSAPLPLEKGQRISHILEQVHQKCQGNLSVAVPCPKETLAFSALEKAEIRRTSTALRVRTQALLQIFHKI